MTSCRSDITASLSFVPPLSPPTAAGQSPLAYPYLVRATDAVPRVGRLLLPSFAASEPDVIDVSGLPFGLPPWKCCSEDDS